MIRSRLFALFLLPLFIAACASDSTTGPGTNDGSGNFRMQAELTSAKVAIASQKGTLPLAEGATVDSLVINSASFMISEIKLQRKGDGIEEKIKTGPVILSVDQSGVKLVLTDTVPVGTYNKVNFKFHRLNDQEIQPWIADADFANFVTPERYTIILEGFVYVDGVAQPFKYGSKVEEDLKFELAEFVISDVNQTTIVLQLETPEVFKDTDTGEVLDPRDAENHNRIDDAIKAALNTLRK
jgi:hypothetical protein